MFTIPCSFPMFYNITITMNIFTEETFLLTELVKSNLLECFYFSLLLNMTSIHLSFCHILGFRNILSRVWEDGVLLWSGWLHIWVPETTSHLIPRVVCSWLSFLASMRTAIPHLKKIRFNPCRYFFCFWRGKEG